MSDTLKERPILFASEMVRAILDGDKTQTRRVVTRRFKDEGEWATTTPGEGWTPELVARDFPNPFGEAGDRLWVKETWASLVFHRDWESGYIDSWDEASNPRRGQLVYRADPSGFEDNGDTPEARGFRWRSSRFMPRWASRIDLEITAVRIARLQDINDGDCWAEGIERSTESPGLAVTMYSDHASPRRAFNLLWDDINDSRGYGWEKNPWVRVLEFTRVDVPVVITPVAFELEAFR